MPTTAPAMNAHERELLRQLKVRIKQIEGDYDEAIRLDSKAVLNNTIAVVAFGISVYTYRAGSGSTLEWALFIAAGIGCFYACGLTLAQVSQRMRKPDFEAMKPQPGEEEEEFALRTLAMYDEANAKNEVTLSRKKYFLTRMVDVVRVLPVAVISLILATLWQLS